MSWDSMVLNPQWVEWTEDRNRVFADLRAKKAQLLTREPHSAWRGFIERASDFSASPNLGLRSQHLENLLVQIGENAWLCLDDRDFQSPDLVR